MRDRWFSKKDTKGQYDPQVGAAAAANTAVAERAQAWNEDYFNKYVSPVLTQMVDESKTNLDRQGKLFDVQYDQTKTAADRYKSLGIPAEDRYYKMVDDYSAPEEQEKQARGAIGDLRTAQATQAAQGARSLRSLGIDPSSPAAMAAQSDQAVQSAALEAGAATRAREAAKTLGMSLTADAANFGRGGASGVLAAAAGAGGASSAGATGAAQAASVAPGAAANVNTGLGLAQKSYGANLDAYTTANNAAKAASGQASAGIGQALGLAASAIPWPSDRRLKKHAERIATLTHDIGLWLYRYVWEPDDAPLRFGFIADEVEGEFPDAVRTGPGGYKQVDYSKVLV